MRKEILFVVSVFSLSFFLFFGLKHTVYGAEMLQEKIDAETVLDSDSAKNELFEPMEIADTDLTEKDSRTHPKTKNGERVRYNTRYYLTDKNLPNSGGATYSPWVGYDYVRFDHNPTYRGIPIIFESRIGKRGYIESNDEIIIKSTDANWAGRVYWHFTDRMASDGVILTNNRYIFGNIYGSTSDNSIGLSMTGVTTAPGTPFTTYLFAEFHGNTRGTPWMTSRRVHLNNLNQVPPVAHRMTPFYLEVAPLDRASVRPVANPTLFVNSAMTLVSQQNIDEGEFYKFSYLPAQDAYFIIHEPTNNRLAWTGGSGEGNLYFSPTQNVTTSHLWIIDSVDNGYVIRSKRDPTMVWDIHNFISTSGGRIKLEKEHSPSSPQREAQIFSLIHR